MTGPIVDGHVEAGFEPVRDAFVRNFTDHGEVGASVSVVIDGKTVVDLWGGSTSRLADEPWQRDTLVNVYSCTKGLTALCAHVLADGGLLDLDAPVCEVWPEFAEAGKSTMPVRYLLTHEAGLPVIDEELPPNAVVDWQRMVDALERQPPSWEPGSAQGYHAVTFGWLVGEVVRRVAGTDTFSEALRQLVTEPLGLDFHVGLADQEHHRVAQLVRDVDDLMVVGRSEGVDPDSRPAFARSDADLARLIDTFASPDSLARRSMALASAPYAPSESSPEWRRAQVPGANGHGTARALARVYGALARDGEIDGVRIISPDGVHRAARQCVSGPDAVLVMPTRRSLGFMLPVSGGIDRRGPNSFGHAGAGGSLGYADPDRALGFGYAMNRLWSGGFMSPDPRAQSLVAAVHESLDV